MEGTLKRLAVSRLTTHLWDCITICGTRCLVVGMLESIHEVHILQWLFSNHYPTRISLANLNLLLIDVTLLVGRCGTPELGDFVNQKTNALKPTKSWSSRIYLDGIFFNSYEQKGESFMNHSVPIRGKHF